MPAIKGPHFVVTHFTEPHDSYYGKVLDITTFTLKNASDEDNESWASVLHLEKCQDYYDSRETLMADLHYVIDRIRFNSPGAQERYGNMLIQTIISTIKEPIGTMTEYGDVVDFFWTQGGDILNDMEGFWEGACWFVFNASAEVGKHLTSQFRRVSDENSSENDEVERIWRFNKTKSRTVNPRHEPVDDDVYEYDSENN